MDQRERDEYEMNLCEFVFQIVDEPLLRLGFPHHCWHLTFQMTDDVCMYFSCPSTLYEFIYLQSYIRKYENLFNIFPTYEKLDAMMISFIY